MANKYAVVIPNWNGIDSIAPCLESLQKQTLKAQIIVVDNGSTDDSVELIKQQFPGVTLLELSRNLGFAGGVNIGINYGLEKNIEYIGLFNNDAVADKSWLKHLVSELDKNNRVGIATGKLLDADRKHIDSTGDLYTTWGLPYPRGRGEPVSDKYDSDTEIFAASGGASLYRAEMFRQVGLFDQDFFAYYEDIDLSFRAQLAGWKVAYIPNALAFHQIGATSGKLKGFVTYQTIKNLPWLMWKDVPGPLLPTILARFSIAYLSFVIRALGRGQVGPVFKGTLVSLLLLPKKIVQRFFIQHNRSVTADYIKSILVFNLPPNARCLRAVRAKWWKLRHRSKSNLPEELTEPKGPKKIVIDGRELRTSSGRYVERLLYYLGKIDHRHRYIVLLKPKDIDDWQLPGDNFSKLACPYKEFTFAEQLGFLRQLRSLNAHLVHFAMVQQPILYQGKVVTTMQDLTTARFTNPSKNLLVLKIKQTVYRWVNKIAARKSAAIITPSEFVKDDVARFARINSRKITVTYEAADPIDAAAESLPELEDLQFIMYVGRPMPHKNLERLIEAFNLVRQQFPALRLVLAGKRDTLYKQLEKQTEQKGIKNVIFTDFVSEGQLRWLYENTAAYVFPSLSEGFGLPGLEAMMAGAPVVSSNATCLPEVYKDGAEYFDPLSVDDMAAAISRVLGDDKLRQQLISKGRQVAEKYSWQRTAEETLTVYKQVLDEQSLI